MTDLVQQGARVAGHSFCPRDKEWWEYLDQIWDAAEAAERTSVTVLPALMLRARKQSASSGNSH